MTNNTIRYILAALAVAAFLPGCTREAEPSAPVVLTAVLEQTYTRTAYDGALGKLTWTEGDQVAVHVGNSYQTADITPSDGHLAISETSSAYRNHYAVYPASVADAGNYGNPTLKVNLPASYDISDIVSGASAIRTSDFSPCPMVAVNDTYDSMLRFYHVGGLLRITLTGVKAATKTVTVTFDKDVTGSYAVSDPATDHPTITTGGAATNNVVTFTVASSSVGSTSAPIVLNVPVPCGTYNSVTVSTLDDGGASLASKTYDEEPLTFLRHHGKKLAFGELAIDLSMDLIPDIAITGEPVTSDHSEEISVTVDRYSSDVWVSNEPWKAYFSETEPSVGERLSAYWSETPLQDAYGNDWLTLSAYEGNGDADQVTVSLASSPFTKQPRERDWMINAARIRDELRSGSGASDVDLSRYDILDGSVTGDCETANCYVIKSYGSYLIPCVYGNAYKSGAPNPDSYQTSVTGEVIEYDRVYTVLNNFINADGNAIGDPVITRDPNLTVSSQLKARVVWQDVMPGFEIITDDDLEYMPTAGTAANCPYIRVNFPKDKIASGNIVVALYDELNEKILWSWHLWVTTDTLETIGVMQNDDVTVNQFLNVPIGWTPPITYLGGITSERSQYVVFVSKSSGVAVGSFLVSQAEYDERRRKQTEFRRLSSDRYSGTTYTWGRKDPYVPSLRGNTHRPMSFPSDFPATIRRNSGLNYSYENLSVAKLGTVSSPETIYQMWVRMPYAFIHYNGALQLNMNLWDVDSHSFETIRPDEAVSFEDYPIVKTVYDPSPRGFHVPNAGAFTGFFANEDQGYYEHFWLSNNPNANGWLDVDPSQWKDMGLYVSANGYFYEFGYFDQSNLPEIYSYFACTTNHTSDENSFNFILYHDYGHYFNTDPSDPYENSRARNIFAIKRSGGGPWFHYQPYNGDMFEFGYDYPWVYGGLDSPSCQVVPVQE